MIGSELFIWFLNITICIQCSIVCGYFFFNVYFCYGVKFKTVHVGWPVSWNCVRWRCALCSALSFNGIVFNKKKQTTSLSGCSGKNSKFQPPSCIEQSSVKINVLWPITSCVWSFSICSELSIWKIKFCVGHTARACFGHWSQ